MFYFTSVTANYISKARILAKTLKQYNHDATFILALSDSLPSGFDIGKEPFDEVLLTDRFTSIPNINTFFFSHNVTEICTAVKPLTALEIMDRYNAEKVCYLDPDIAVFSQLVEIEYLLDQYSMIFTPHATEPEEKENYIIGNEILFLKRGTNNLGFFAVKNDEEGRKFLRWWNERLMKFCLDDDITLEKLLNEQNLLGLFTDQKWIDLVPSFFDNYYILKHPGYNVSTWNLSHRKLTRQDNQYLVNGEPLRFFHFSGVDSGAHSHVLEQLYYYYPHVKEAKKLSQWYLEQEKHADPEDWKSIEWKYCRYENGIEIPKMHRKILLIRRDIQSFFQNPFEINNRSCYYNWMMQEYGDYIKSKSDQPSATIFLDQSKFVKCIKFILIRFISPESRIYFKLKNIYRILSK